MELYEKIRILRKARGLSQEQLGDKLSRVKRDGISRQTISDWENGNFEPKLDNIRDLAEVLNVTFNSLLDDSIDLNNEKVLDKVLNKLPKKDDNEVEEVTEVVKVVSDRHYIHLRNIIFLAIDVYMLFIWRSDFTIRIADAFYSKLSTYSTISLIAQGVLYLASATSMVFILIDIIKNKRLKRTAVAVAATSGASALYCTYLLILDIIDFSIMLKRINYQPSKLLSTYVVAFVLDAILILIYVAFAVAAIIAEKKLNKDDSKNVEPLNISEQN